MDPQIRVLVVDDDEPHAQAVAESLGRVGYDCTVAVGGREALRLIEEHDFDIVITDLVMEPVGGLEVLQKAKRELPDAEVVILTGHSTVQTAVRAMQGGAATYLTKPLDINELRLVADKASQSRRLARENIELHRQLQERFGFEGVVGNSPQMKAIIDKLRQVSPTPATVLILGESGTGKELVAKAIHNNSPRKSKPFVALNCAALSDTILESELFGHIKGAFTGADRERKGLIEHSNGGTLFLDEIGDLPPQTQVKLLRVIESGEILRMGSNEPIHVNVRLVTATNRDLPEMIKEGKFRTDLYHRIKVISIKLPPLRDRREDIPLLIDYFVREFAGRYGRPIPGISADLRKALMAYSWPGNVRQLRNVVESLLVIDTDGELGLDDLTDEELLATVGTAPQSSGTSQLVGQPMEAIEAHYIAETLRLTGGNREEAARLLGIGERTLYRKLKEYNIT
ncbi:sigma-54-dependent transcriptional regulator [Tautonia plasticadhaerens]|uniref:DNA-binding transcriptional response regulator n=1 Tax=Tautonia plasticadhaerens TaxID=2527974 RepID=A0A518GZ48_9BACT|nr:sigma-54 dependent transcriptional regulator [Tautonia plasticadhaerens]QDV33886.1 DNA-binding transcriptional response regulator [Tautonia plasticadhaerens]